MKTTRLVAALTVIGAFMQAASPLHPQEAVHTIEIHAHRFGFVPAEIAVKKGETVKLDLISDDVTHALVIQDLGINQAITKGRPSVVTFTASKPGDFHGQCGRFCGSGHGSMTFTVHVKQD